MLKFPKKMPYFWRRLIKIVIFLFFFSILFLFFFTPEVQKKINWGVVFSQKHAQLLGLDWKKTYSEILSDLKAKKIKVIVHWDLVEPERENFNFEDLDWMIKEAENKGGEVILVIGIKTGRWPECHIPSWLQKKKEEEIKSEALKYIFQLVERYKNSKNIFAWQVENEPFFAFGECPKIEKEFVKKEIEIVRSLDSKRPIIFADSGEFSFWIEAAKLADIVSATLHRKVYFREIKRYITYPFPPSYYWIRAKIIEKVFKRKVIIGELQAEPWCKNLLYNCALKEQKITMDFQQFKKNIEFAKKTGLDTFYFWGVEWWYWLKTKQNLPQIWQEAKNYLK